jgi:Iap family predicted aminopeptidase
VVAEGKVEIKGTIQSVDLQNKTAVIKTADKTLITVIIENKDVLKRLEKGCISEGDFVYVKYVVKDGKNVSTYFWPLGPVE